MFETDKLIYIHMQKTAGTRITEILRDTVGGQQVGRAHSYPERKPQGKLVLGSIRNPWAWYVSLWAFGCEGRGGLLFAHLRGDPNWMANYADADDPKLFREWLKLAYSYKYIRKMRNGFQKFSLRQQVGLMTWRYAYLYMEGIGTETAPYFDSYDSFETHDMWHNVVDWWVRLERIGPDLIQALGQAGYNFIHDETKQSVVEMAEIKSNTSSHLPWRDYYDTETADLVRQRERLIIRKHGYHLGSI